MKGKKGKAIVKQANLSTGIPEKSSCAPLPDQNNPLPDSSMMEEDVTTTSDRSSSIPLEDEGIQLFHYVKENPQKSQVNIDAIKVILSVVNSCMIDSEEPFLMSLLSIIMGVNCLFLGPPGTGKSRIARCMMNLFRSRTVNPFELNCHPNTALEELFGQFSTQKIELGLNEREIEKMLPDAQLAMLDELFKASPRALTSLLTILNERQYKHGTKFIPTPLWSALILSNETPNESSQNAFFDRILFRVFIDNIPEELYYQVFTANLHDIENVPTVSLENIKLISKQANDCVKDISTEFFSDYITPLLKYTTMVDEEVTQILGEGNSDDRVEVVGGKLITIRRLRQLRDVLKVVAYTNNRLESHVIDVYLCTFCLWKRKMDKDRIFNWAMPFIRSKLNLNNPLDVDIVQNHLWLTRKAKEYFLTPDTSGFDCNEEVNRKKDMEEKIRRLEADRAKFNARQEAAALERAESMLKVESENLEALTNLTALEVEAKRNEMISQQLARQNELTDLKIKSQENINRQLQAQAHKNAQYRAAQSAEREEFIRRQENTRALLDLIDNGKETEDNIKLVETYVKGGVVLNQLGGSDGGSCLDQCCFKGKLKFFTKIIANIEDATGSIWKTSGRGGFYPIHLVLCSNNNFNDGERVMVINLIVTEMKRVGIDISTIKVQEPGFVSGDRHLKSVAGFNAEDLIKRWFHGNNQQALLRLVQ